MVRYFYSTGIEKQAARKKWGTTRPNVMRAKGKIERSVYVYYDPKSYGYRLVARQ